MYYVTIICWAFYMMVWSFLSPLHWSDDYADKHQEKFTGGCEEISPADRFFLVDLLHALNDECETVELGSSEQIVAPIFGFYVLIFVILFFTTFKGVTSESWTVYVTVPLPIITLLVMLFRSLTLEGAGEGIKKYIGE